MYDQEIVLAVNADISMLQIWRRRTAEKPEEEQVKQLRAAMTQLDRPGLLALIDG